MPSFGVRSPTVRGSLNPAVSGIQGFSQGPADNSSLDQLKGFMTAKLAQLKAQLDAAMVDLQKVPVLQAALSDLRADMRDLGVSELKLRVSLLEGGLASDTTVAGSDGAYRHTVRLANTQTPYFLCTF